MAATTEQGRRTRDRLVAAAAELIREQGVEKTSIDQILARTGASKSQLYHYFDDKQALVREVIAYQTERRLRLTVIGLSRVTSWATLRSWFEQIMALQAADGFRYGCPLGSIAAELADHNDQAREDLAASFARWEIAIAEMLDRLKAGGRLRPRADTRALAVATLAAIQGGLLLSKTFRDPAPLRGALDATYAYLRANAAVTSRTDALD